MFEKGSVMLSVWGKALEAEGTANVVAWRQERVFRGAAGDHVAGVWPDEGENGRR